MSFWFNILAFPIVGGSVIAGGVISSLSSTSSKPAKELSTQAEVSEVLEVTDVVVEEPSVSVEPTVEIKEEATGLEVPEKAKEGVWIGPRTVGKMLRKDGYILKTDFVEVSLALKAKKDVHFRKRINDASGLDIHGTSDVVLLEKGCRRFDGKFLDSAKEKDFIKMLKQYCYNKFAHRY